MEPVEEEELHLYGSIRIYTDLHGSIRIYTDIYGTIGLFMELLEEEELQIT